MSTTNVAEYRHFIAGELSDAGEGYAARRPSDGTETLMNPEAL
jgi:hypothetical protein